uniref:Uncharacterized protein n=1 Tax=Anguilla anguilla TaxID=7936 RepID=A0A0E9PGW3_ANGAN
MRPAEQSLNDSHVGHLTHSALRATRLFIMYFQVIGHESESCRFGGGNSHRCPGPCFIKK